MFFSYLRKFLPVVLVATVVLFAVFGCSSDDDDNPTGPSSNIFPESLVGSWDYEGYVTDGILTLLDGFTSITFESDGTWISYLMDNEFSSGTATVTEQDPQDILSLIVVASLEATQIGDTLSQAFTSHDTYTTLDVEEEGETDHYILVRNNQGNNALIGVVYTQSSMNVLANANVSISYAAGDPIVETTDQYGLFYREINTVGDVTITTSMTGYQDNNSSASISADSTIFLAMGMTTEISGPTGTATGTITDSVTESPIANVTVVSDDNVTATTNAVGVYEMTITAGMRTLTFSATGYTTFSQTVYVFENQTADLSIPLVPSTTGGDTGRIDGTVRNAADMSTLMGATVTCDDGTQTTTNPQGSYVFLSAAVGTRSVTVTMNGFTSSTLTVAVTQDQASTLNFDMNATVAATCNIRGRAHDFDTGNPMHGVTVTAASGETTTTDINTGYTLSLAVPMGGSVNVTYSKLGFATQEIAVSGLYENATVTQDVEMHPDSEIAMMHGRVFNASTSQGIENAYVYSVTTGSEAYTSASGYYSMQVAIDQDNILVTADGYADLNQNVSISAGTNQEMNFNLTPEGGGDDCTILGTIHTANGINTIPHARVSVSASEYVYSDHDGNYSLVVPEGEQGFYEVTVTCTGFVSETNNVGVSAGQESPLDFSLDQDENNMVIYGTVVDDAGNPLGGVTFTGVSGSAEGTSRSDGTYTILPGIMHQDIEAYKDGYVTQRQNYTISWGQALRLDWVIQAN
jgi:Carboxypeptidase regulatory-like domain/CarboxypepD_reg-like domain